MGEPLPGAEIYEALRVAMGVSYLERRSVELQPSAVASWPPPVSTGSACSDATDALACQQTLAALSTQDVLFPFELHTFLTSVRGFYLAYTKGDVVGKISSPAELEALLPTLTQPVAALAYAQASGYRVECQNDWAREEPDGFVIRASKLVKMCDQRDQVVLFVRHDGTIEERDRVPGPAACL